MIRSLLERLSRGKSFRRRLPSEFSSRCLYVSPDSALSYLIPKWDSGALQLMSVAKRFIVPGSNVWDIGANVGVFAIAAAHRAGGCAEVVAVEPDPFLASLLQRSALHGDNQDLQISVLCLAVSNETGLARFLIAARGRSSNSLEQAEQRTQAGGIRFVQHVPTTTLDALLAHFRCPAFIKIDVEGAEAIVLEGADRVLSECRPTLYVEVGPTWRERVAEILTQHRYRMFDGDSLDECEVKECTWNTLAVPSELNLTNRGY